MPAVTPANKRLIDQLVVVHYDYRALMRLTAALGEMRYSVISAESEDVLPTALRLANDQPAAMIVGLRGDENVADIRELLAKASNKGVLFLVREPPPRAALARVINAYGSAILREDEAPIVMASTLVALLTTREDGESSFSPNES